VETDILLRMLSTLEVGGIKMIKIPLTQGQVAIVDGCDRHLKKWKWFAVYNTGGCDNYRAVRQIRINGNQKFVYMQHMILGQPFNKKYVIDHINGDPLDNRRRNLRIVTQRENAWNNKTHRNKETSSSYVGVSWSKRNKRWISHIWINKKTKYLGSFKSEKMAAICYKNKLKKIEGGIYDASKDLNIQ